ncbi:MAG TPA: DUF2877 domain-containing protein [Alphaproteobacteria bacterium]|nr:DUF2877 domain-containing protein [Alphaproteobacteria bacterium]
MTLARASAEPPLAVGILTASAIGCTALAAVRASRGVVRRLADSGGSAFWAAGDEVVWLTSKEPLPHPRAIALSAALPSDASEGLLSLDRSTVWRPSLPVSSKESVSALVARARTLATALLSLERPRGLGVLLAGGTPDFPLAHAGEGLARFADAARAGDPDEIARAAGALIGLGPGLTPSGDDYLAGISFATRLLAAADPGLSPRGRTIRHAIRRAIQGRTNRVSASLLRDATDGLGFRAMHELCDALAAGHSGAAERAARGLAAIGHSSGWDLLVGLVAGLKAPPSRSPRRSKSGIALAPRLASC